jgi:hypothetical protein
MSTTWIYMNQVLILSQAKIVVVVHKLISHAMPIAYIFFLFDLKFKPI